ncbi:MAG: copper chaperone PCu(A)C [Hyphomonadaceae bacterium]
MNTILRSIAAVAVFALAACTPPAATPEQTAEQGTPAITLVDPWAGATPDGATVGAGYVVLRNEGDGADRLVSATSPRAGHVELHEMRMEGDMMRMSPVEAIDVPAHGETALAPGGLHIMFIDIPAPLAEGESIPVTLHFEQQGDVEAVFVVRQRDAMEH